MIQRGASAAGPASSTRWVMVKTTAATANTRRADQNQAVSTVHMTTVDTRLLYSNNCMKTFFGRLMHMMLLEEEVNCLAMLVPEHFSHRVARNILRN
jgi:hypothetical protein